MADLADSIIRPAPTLLKAKHFGFGQLALDKSYVVCKLCHTKIKYVRFHSEEEESRIHSGECGV